MVEPERWLELALATKSSLELLLLEQRCSRWCSRLRQRWYRRCCIRCCRCCKQELERRNRMMVPERHSNGCDGSERVVACSNELLPKMRPRTGPQRRPTYKMRDSYHHSFTNHGRLTRERPTIGFLNSFLSCDSQRLISQLSELSV